MRIYIWNKKCNHLHLAVHFSPIMVWKSCKGGWIIFCLVKPNTPPELVFSCMRSVCFLPSPKQPCRNRHCFLIWQVLEMTVVFHPWKLSQLHITVWIHRSKLSFLPWHLGQEAKATLYSAYSQNPKYSISHVLQWTLNIYGKRGTGSTPDYPHSSVFPSCGKSPQKITTSVVAPTPPKLTGNGCTWIMEQWGKTEHLAHG